MSPMPSPPPLNEPSLRIEICRDADDLARHAAGLFVSLAGRSLGARRQFTVALSGGETPRRMYRLLTEEHYAFQVVWSAVQVFFSDERCVPPDHPDSNYRMAGETLLSRVPVPPQNVHRLACEGDPDDAASAAGKDLLAQFGGVAPRFDCILLGVGTDGHTASLFPGSPALQAADRLVAATTAPDGSPRLTLTLPVINAARTVMVLASGESKAAIVRRVLGARAVPEGLPMQRVRPLDGQLIWILDEAAASSLAPQDPPAGT